MELDKLNVQDIQIEEVSWIGIIVEDTEENILLVLENDNKAWKRSGQWSTPFGTSRENEEPLETAIRELKEETWISVLKKDICKIWNIKVAVTEKEYLYKIQATIFHVITDKKTLLKASKFKNGEIWEICLEKLENIKKKKLIYVRPGSLEALYLVKVSPNFPDVIKIENWFYEKEYRETTIKKLREQL